MKFSEYVIDVKTLNAVFYMKSDFDAAFTIISYEKDMESDENLVAAGMAPIV